MRTGSLCLFAALGLLACDGCGESRPSSVTPPNQTVKDPSSVVTGHVKLAAGFELPSYLITDMERKVLTHTERGKWPEACTPPKNADRQAVKLTPEGFLQGVMVGASEFTGAKPRPPVTHDVTIEDCRLTPQLVVAVKGDMVRLTNKVDFPFMPSFGPTAVVRTLSNGQSFEFPLTQGNVESLRCGFTAPCGRTDVITVYHPVFDVTDASGTFTIENFPADQGVKVHAWHPLFKEVEVTVQIGLGETKTVELVLEPQPQYLPGAEPPPAAAVADAGTAPAEAAPAAKPVAAAGAPAAPDAPAAKPIAKPAPATAPAAPAAPAAP